MKMTSKKENVFKLTDPWKQEAPLHGEYQGLSAGGLEGVLGGEGLWARAFIVCWKEHVR